MQPTAKILVVKAKYSLDRWDKQQPPIMCMLIPSFEYFALTN
jgi:hypothetical protein